jgi:protein tyrosine phosphatase (PTP) superfamily phosphohydrolase (DUF442 family)
VTSGLKPQLDGLSWLYDNGYRTVLHIKQADEDDSADRQIVEKRGLRYLALSVAPTTLSRATVDEFNRIVADAGRQPLFVYDRDGTLAGALWYLHFRMVGRDSDETARTKAGRLGLKIDGSGAPRDIWLAIQRLLTESKL